jgi:hypothetical protein
MHQQPTRGKKEIQTFENGLTPVCVHLCDLKHPCSTEVRAANFGKVRKIHKPFQKIQK